MHKLHPEQKLKPTMLIYLVVSHIAALYGLYLLLSAKVESTTALVALFFAYCSGFGVTGGMHRLWSHRSYSAKWLFRFIVMLCASMANQGSIYHWVRDHRVHHKYSEKEADPHNANLGFFYSHMGWLMVNKHPETIKEGKSVNMDDIHKDSIVMWQKTVHPWFDIFMCFVFPGLVCMLLGDTYWNGVFVAGALKYVLILHFTWFVNSFAHMFGYRTYEPNIGPAENLFVSILAGGEGYHNWHHVYPYDYAASEFGYFGQWNPTKLVIDFAARLGLVENRRRKVLTK